MPLTYEWTGQRPRDLESIATTRLCEQVLVLVPDLANAPIGAKRDGALAEAIAAIIVLQASVRPDGGLYIETGTMALGAVAPVAQIGFNIQGPVTATATTQYGMISQPTVSAASTTAAVGYGVQVNTPVAAMTVAELIGVRVFDAVQGAGSTITTQYGVYVHDQTKGGTNYAIYTNVGLVRFGDRVLTVASESGGAKFNLPHGVAPSAPVDGDVWTTSAGLFVRVNGVSVGPLS